MVNGEYANIGVRHALEDSFCIYEARLPESLGLTQGAFQSLWSLHPEDHTVIKMHGRDVAIPRWQQAFGADYHYSGQTNEALPVPSILEEIHSWAKATIDGRLNGILVNWYDGEKKHYIGKHRDSTTNMVEDCPIVTVSLGATRTFRIRPWRGRGFTDFLVDNGSVLVMPYGTNLKFTHEVLHRTCDVGKRISVTLRGFEVARAY